MYRFVTALSVLLVALPALGQFDSGSNGTDGAFNPQADVQIDLALAASLCDCDSGGQLDDPCESTCPSPVPGRGVYDATEWAVVFNYMDIDIPAGVTVTFVNHRKGAPVVWLASGNVNIGGTVRLDGAIGSVDPNSPRALPGPGGFSGGTTEELGRSAGFGPGGGEFDCNGFGGGYGSPGDGTPGGAMYGTVSIDPLIGGSGGGGGYCGGTRSGGAGGGAILIASSGTIDITGVISANGGGGFSAGAGGSGGGHSFEPQRGDYGNINRNFAAPWWNGDT